MKKLLELNNETLRTGRTRSKFMPGGLWDNAQGLNPYLENDDYRGTLAVTAAPTDLTGSVIVDNPIAYAKWEKNSTYLLYVMGDGGNIYRISIGGSITITNLHNMFTSSSYLPANGMAVFQPKGGSAVLLYASQNRIGTYDLSSLFTDSTYSTGTTTPHRPMHPFFDRVYYGNLNYVGQFADSGSSTITHTAQALDLEAQETVTALSDDGRYLIIATSRTVDESFDGASRVRILFWDTNKDSWDWEASIPNEFSIRGFKRVGDVVYAVGKRGLYTVAFGVAPKLQYAFDSDETIAFDASSYGHVQSIAAWGDGVIFGKLGTAFSKFLPNTQRMVYNPLQGFEGDIGLIIPDFIENKVLVGTRSAKLYSFDMTAPGTTSDVFWTRLIDLEGKYHIQRIDVVIPLGVQPGDELQIAVSGIDQSKLASVDITYDKYPGATFLSLPLGKNVTTPQASVGLIFSQGAPSLYSITLWGEPAT